MFDDQIGIWMDHADGGQQTQSEEHSTPLKSQKRERTKNRSRTARHCLTTTAFVLLVLFAGPGLAEVVNDQIGFSSNHVFDSAIQGETIDLLNGNVNLRIPIGHRYQLSDSFGYQLQLYYNSKIWWNKCPGVGYCGDGNVDPGEQCDSDPGCDPTWCRYNETCGDGDLDGNEACDDGNNNNYDECPHNCVPHCPGYLTGSDEYGVGFSLHFGRIYHHADDEDNIFRYQQPDGSEHFFCSQQPGGDECPFFGNYTYDSSSMHIQNVAGGWWVYPDDGTKIIFDATQMHNGGTYDPVNGNQTGGWYATRIEVLRENEDPAVHWVDINYSTEVAGRIESIEDSAFRQINFSYPAGQVEIQLPGFGGTVATYTLVLESPTAIKDPDPPFASQNVKVLKELHLPELQAGEMYQFDYGDFGYISRWTIPTGAWVDYFYRHYRSGWLMPVHSELVAKVLNTDASNSYTWTYTRFATDPARDPDEAMNQQEGTFFLGTNPSRVSVLDPFDNLTVYWFYWHAFDSEDCDNLGCPSWWNDGLLSSMAVYAGPEQNSSRMVRQELWEYTYDLPYTVQYNKSSTVATANRIGINVRPAAKTVTTFGGGDYPTTTYRTEYDDWRHVGESGGYYWDQPPVARVTREYENGALYRSTYTDYEPIFLFRHRYHYVDIRNASDEIVSRTIRGWTVNRPRCELRLATNFTRFNCGAQDDGDVHIDYSYDLSTDELSQKVVQGGDPNSIATAQTLTTNYAFSSGVLATKKHPEFEWNLVDRDIDESTGLVSESRDSAGIATSYDWDTLGRLRQISPSSPEAPVDIDYLNILKTRVTQTADSENVLESTYLYDTLGRLYEERRKSFYDDVPYEFRRSEYDISGRLQRQSLWAASTTPEEELQWTVYEYDSPFLNPSADPGESPYFVDPFGRVSRVIRPDGSETTTSYEGQATVVTVSGINGSGGPIESTTTYVNDSFGRLVQVDSPGEGADAIYLYDELDNLTEVRLIDPYPPEEEDAEQIRRFIYDSLGRLRAATNPENGTVEYLLYDALGNLLRYRDARGEEITMAYDHAGRPTTKDVDDNTLLTYRYSLTTGKPEGHTTFRPDGSEVADIHVNYGSTPVLCPTSQPTEALSYLGLNGRVASIQTTIGSWDQQLDLDYCYNKMGQRNVIRYPDYDTSPNTERSEVEYLYKHGYLWEVHDVQRDFEYLNDVQYDVFGNPTELIRGNGLIDVMEYDDLGRPERFQMYSPDVNPLSTRPSVDSLFGCGQNGGGLKEVEFCIQPPDTSGLIEWDSGTYQYDDAGNISGIGSDVYHYDELNRLVHAAVSSPLITTAYDVDYVYDAFGNMTSRTKTPTTGLPITYDYSIQRSTNRLLDVVRNGTPTSYQYDGAGNVTIEGPTGYIFDSLNRLREVWSDESEGGDLVAKYDYDANGYRVRSEMDGTETFYLRDASGQLLSEFRRAVGAVDEPAWNKDYIYALGRPMTMLKNEDPQTPGRPWASNVSDTGLTLHWDPVEDPDVGVYLIERTVTSPGSPTTVTSHAAIDTQYSDSFDPAIVDPDTVIDYAVRARDNARNESAKSPALRVRPFDDTPPPAPANISGTELDSAVTVTWAGVDLDDLWGYKVERDGPPVQGWPEQWSSITALPVQGTEISDFGLTNGEWYKYRVRTVDTSGNESEYPSDPVHGTDFVALKPKDGTPPARPFGVTAQPGLGAQSIVVKWDPVLDPDLQGYTVRDTGSQTEYVIDDADAIAYEVTGLAEGTTYTFTVLARDTSGNQSLESDPATATTRNSSVATPGSLAGSFEVDTNGTLGTYDDCDVSHEFDDVIGVRLDWAEAGGPVDDYRVYRADGTSDNYAAVADVSELDACDTGTCTYFDPTPGGFEYTYYVVSLYMNDESPASNEVSVLDEFDAGTLAVRTSLALDRREDYWVKNAPSRVVGIWWSPLMESQLQGYHVYRRCRWHKCPASEFFRNPRDLSCVHSWVRLTNFPVSQNYFTDTTTGWMNQCFDYAVRPVGPNGEEGQITKLLDVNLHWDYPGEEPGENVHCIAEGYSFDIITKEQIPTLEEMDRVNGITRGAWSPGGAPAAPTLVDYNENACSCGSVYTSPCPPAPNGCSPVFPDHDNARNDEEDYSNLPLNAAYAFIDWEQNQESDLAGYFVEMAGSIHGPWVRVTEDPIAWWETHYDARIWQKIDEDAATPNDAYHYGFGPDCAVFRVIAVDENGNESDPSALFQVRPVADDPDDPYGGFPEDDDCSASTPTLYPPLNLTASTETETTSEEFCTTRLEWEPQPDAQVLADAGVDVSYRVYRFVFDETDNELQDRFYVTGEVPHADCLDEDADGTKDKCVFIEAGDADNECPLYDSNIGIAWFCRTTSLDAFYVTAVESVVEQHPRESPRSNVVFWNCDTTPGYASLRLEDAIIGTDEPYDAIAAVERDILWCEGLPELTVGERGNKSHAVETAELFGTWGSPAAAPLLTLGQSAPDPPYEILDLHVDHLGSIRVVTDDNGIVSRHDFFPFGEEIAPVFDYNTKMFTGHERDEETGLDYMLARYYPGNVARFLTPDPSGQSISPTFPSSWNKYSYVLNNPLRLSDPTGEVPFDDLSPEAKSAIDSAAPGVYSMLQGMWGEFDRQLVDLTGSENYNYKNDAWSGFDFSLPQGYPPKKWYHVISTSPPIPRVGLSAHPADRGILEVFLFIAANSRIQPGRSGFAEGLRYLIAIADNLNLDRQQWKDVIEHLRNIVRDDPDLLPLIKLLEEKVNAKSKTHGELKRREEELKEDAEGERGIITDFDRPTNR